jgi:hypothetical protein
MQFWKIIYTIINEFILFLLHLISIYLYIIGFCRLDGLITGTATAAIIKNEYKNKL